MVSRGVTRRRTNGVIAGNPPMRDVLVRIADVENTVADIARLSGYSRQAVQRLADALAADGLIRQVADAHGSQLRCVGGAAARPHTRGDLVSVTAALEHPVALMTGAVRAFAGAVLLEDDVADDRWQ